MNKTQEKYLYHTFSKDIYPFSTVEGWSKHDINLVGLRPLTTRHLNRVLKLYTPAAYKAHMAWLGDGATGGAS